MKKLNKFLASALAIATVIGAGSCGGGGGRTQGAGGGNDAGTGAAGGGDAASTTAAETTTVELTTAETFGTNEGVQEAASSITVNEDLHPQKKLIFLSSWYNEENTAEYEIFRSNYGVPEAGEASYGDYADAIIVWNSYAYGTGYDKLGQMVASGDSPDMYEFTTLCFPYTAYRNMFQPIDDVIDMSGPEWDGYREISHQITWNGKMYCPVNQLRVEDLWYYRKSVLEEAGLPDPYQLFLDGEWDWDHLLDFGKQFKQTGDGKYLVDGWYYQAGIMNSSGVPMIGIDDSGKIINNLFTPEIERAAAVLRTMAEQGYCYPLVENGWSVNYKAWLAGDTLFMTDGDWFWRGDLYKYMKKMQIENTDFFFVPTPKNPNAEGHPCDYDVFGYAFCAGSTNVDSYRAWNKCLMLAKTDEAAIEAGKKQDYENHNWTDEAYDLLWNNFENPVGTTLTPVFDYSYGVGTDGIRSTSGDVPMDHIMKIPSRGTDQPTFEQAREEYANVINTNIDELNAALGF